MAAKPITIIGGGIAGLAMGLFARARGLQAQIWEKREESVGIDHLIWMAPNGLRLLQQINLLDQVLQAGTRQSALHFCSHNLDILSSLDGEHLEQDVGHSIVAIRRTDLLRIMQQAYLDIGGNIQYKREFSDLTFDESGAPLLLGDDPSMQAGLIVGADGMHSRLRHLCFPEAQVKFQGVRAWLGQSRVALPSQYNRQTFEVFGHGRRFVFYKFDDHQVYWSALESTSQLSTSELHPVNPLLHVKKNFYEFHDDILKIIEAGDSSHLLPWNFSMVANLPTFNRDQVVLIGDAAHGMPPHLGQGASLALEDASILSFLLKESKTTKEALSYYSQARQARIAKMMTMAKTMNTVFQTKSPWFSRVRNIAMKWSPDRWTVARAVSLYKEDEFLKKASL